jgi:hypothetical protein
MSGKRRPNRAAFARADVAAAKRGAPSVNLNGYAAARNLRFLDHVTPAGYRASIPADPELQANVMLGTLPGGVHGMLAHESLRLPIAHGRIAWSASFYGVNVSNVEGFRLRALIPIISDLFPVDTSFPDALAPCTVAAVRLPETVAVQQRLRIDKIEKAPPFDFGNPGDLGEFGLPGWRIQTDPPADPSFLSDVLADPVASCFKSHDQDALFQVIVRYGTLTVRRNGYFEDPASLDELGQATSAIAAALRRACGARLSPRPFRDPLPPPGSHRGTAMPIGYGPEPPWPMWSMRLQSEYGLTPEDPVAYHQALPTSPVPGVARLVMRGTLPLVGREGRLVFHAEPDTSRAAVLIAAPPGTPDTAPGGEPLSERRVYYDVGNGIATVWCLPSYTGGAMLGDLGLFLATAASVLAERLPTSH